MGRSEFGTDCGVGISGSRFENENGRRKGEKVFMSTTICEDRLSSHAMNVSG
jgi:hypothetical protein